MSTTQSAECHAQFNLVMFRNAAGRLNWSNAKCRAAAVRDIDITRFGASPFALCRAVA